MAWLFAIVAFCTVVASIWLVRVPFYQEPDEIAHADYIFKLFDVGHPFRVAGTHPAGEVAPQTRYVVRAIDYRKMRYNPSARAPAGYGTTAFFRALDAGAPAPSGRRPTVGAALPYFMYSYPPAYYVLEAAILTATYRLDDSLSTGFFAMRALNVVLLIGTLVLSYFSFRAYGLTERLSLAAVLAIGAFPLVSRISSYIQPDNATTFSYCGRRIRRRPRSPRAVVPARRPRHGRARASFSRETAVCIRRLVSDRASPAF